MPKRTIQSPGVEINEVDLSLRPVINVPTTTLIAGFSPQGPLDEIIQPSSLSEFEQIYSKPVNAAERYFYHTVKAAFQAQNEILVTRLPYGSGGGEGFTDAYSALVYPVTSYNGSYLTDEGTVQATGGIGLSGANSYFFGQPTQLQLTAAEYQSIINGNAFESWKNVPTVFQFNGTGASKLTQLANAGMIVLNKAQTSINNKFEGYYVGVIDNTNLNPATQFEGINQVRSLDSNTGFTYNFVNLPSTRLNFPLSASEFGIGNSVSEVMENLPTFNVSTRQFDDTLLVGLFKLRQSTFGTDVLTLDYVLSESYVGSLDYWRQVNNINGGLPVSFFLGTQEDNSPNMSLLVNPFISNRNTLTWINTAGNPNKKVRLLNPNLAIPLKGNGFVDTNVTYETRVGAPSATVNAILNDGILRRVDALYSFGAFDSTVSTQKLIGSVPDKLQRVFELVENVDLYNVSITVEAGLGTIFAAAEYNDDVLSGGNVFDDTIPLDMDGFYKTNNEAIDGAALTIRENYNTIASQFVNFAQNVRKDHITILDPIRNIFVQGENSKVIDDPANNFNQHIYWPLRHNFALLNTSYAATYGTCAKVFDDGLSKQTWVPFSGFAAAAYANTDDNFQPWFAPAGFTRGVLLGVNDLPVYPNQKQRDTLYKINLNPVAFFPAEGYVIFGQKTLLKKPSAFDRVNVRRLFIYLETATRNTVKYFVFEPNTLFTRTQVVNVLTPIFDLAKNTQGVYDYLIICDERNNTPDVIDQNELVVDIYIKPVRAAEFILVNFYATRTGQDFQELLA
jgi:hypothetical protein